MNPFSFFSFFIDIDPISSRNGTKFSSKQKQVNVQAPPVTRRMLSSDNNEPISQNYTKRTQANSLRRLLAQNAKQEDNATRETKSSN